MLRTYWEHYYNRFGTPPKTNPFDTTIEMLSSTIEQYRYPTMAEGNVIPSDLPKILEQLVLLLQDKIFEKIEELEGHDEVQKRLDTAMKNMRRLLRKVEKLTYDTLNFNDKEAIRAMSEAKRQYFFIDTLLESPEKWEKVTVHTGIEEIVTERLPTPAMLWKKSLEQPANLPPGVKIPILKGKTRECFNWLLKRPMSYQELSAKLKVSVQMVYKYLNTLLSLGLVKGMKEGKRVKYVALTPNELD